MLAVRVTTDKIPAARRSDVQLPGFRLSSLGLSPHRYLKRSRSTMMIGREITVEYKMKSRAEYGPSVRRLLMKR
jgi:hypothetical protein